MTNLRRMNTEPAARATKGRPESELARLVVPAALLAPATRTVLTLAGVTAGMRVLNLGTAAGGVAGAAAELVGPTGAIVGVDGSEAATARARRSCDDRGIANLRLVSADIAQFEPDEDFDAVVAGFVLPNLADPTARVRSLLARLLPDGVFVAMEYDLSAARSHPPTPLVRRTMNLVTAAFEAVGASHKLGPHLVDVLSDAGARSVEILGLQSYLGAADSAGPMLICDVLSNLLPAIQRHGLAAASDLDLGTLTERIAAELIAHESVLLPPTIVGAWARGPQSS